MEIAEIVKGLLDKRGKAWEEAKALNDEVLQAERDLTGEEQQTWDRLMGELKALDDRRTELEDLESANAEAEAARERLAHVVRPSDTASRENAETERIRTWLRSALPDAEEWAPRALTFKLTDADKREVRRAWEQRDLVKGTTTAGGFTVPTGFVRRLYEHLIENSAIRQTNATVLTTDTGEQILVPKTAAHGAGALVAEAGAIPENDPTFGQVPLDAFKYGVLIQVASELIQDTAVDLLGYLARQAGRAVGNASGAHFITGTGSGQPNGVVVAAAIGKTGTTGQTTTIIADDLIDLYHSIVSGYRANSYWLTLDASLAKIRKLKDSDGQYLWQPGLQAGVPDLLLGKPVVTDPNVAAMAANAESVVFGDFSAYTIRDVGTIRFERSDDFAFANDLVTFRCLIRTDGDLVDTNAIKTYANSAT